MVKITYFLSLINEVALYIDYVCFIYTLMFTLICVNRIIHSYNVRNNGQE